MSDFEITNGTAHYEHKKPMGQDYDNKQPSMTLHFTVAEGSDPAAAANRVMAIAQDIVERAITGKITVAEVAAVKPVPPPVPFSEVPVTVTEGPEAVKRRGRPPINPTVPAPVVESDQTPIAPVGDIVDVSIDDDIVVEAEEKTLTLKDDIQPLAQKVSAHLRKDGGNINVLREVIKECGATSLLTIEPAKFPLFIEKAKALLS